MLFIVRKTKLTQYLLNLINENKKIIIDYIALTSGSVGRLIISLAYFVAIANTLSFGEFGLFATTSAVGIVLSRVIAFGFLSPLYRIATVKHHLIGTYTAGYIVALFFSLPIVTLFAYLIYLLIFSSDLALFTFALIIIAETIFWRLTEATIIVCNGIQKFGKASILLVAGSIFRAAAAVSFAFFSYSTLADWAYFYVAANASAALFGLVFFYPRYRLRWKPALYLKRWVDALSVASAEVLFYVQSELDKILVLTIGGPEVSGIYSIVMRLVDLTALPIRSVLTLIVQKLMRTPALFASFKFKLLTELGIAGVSALGISSLIIFLWLFPTALGTNVATITHLLPLVFAVPILRNLTEFQSELLYASKQTVRRAANLTILGATKAGLLLFILNHFKAIEEWVPLLNAVFVVLYVISFMLTYQAIATFNRRQALSLTP